MDFQLNSQCWRGHALLAVVLLRIPVTTSLVAPFALPVVSGRRTGAYQSVRPDCIRALSIMVVLCEHVRKKADRSLPGNGSGALAQRGTQSEHPLSRRR
jgi:hypothetical protein